MTTPPILGRQSWIPIRRIRCPTLREIDAIVAAPALLGRDSHRADLPARAGQTAAASGIRTCREALGTRRRIDWPDLVDGSTETVRKKPLGPSLRRTRTC